MFHIPEEVFQHQILQFLKFDEVSAFLSSSNSLFEELRYRSGKRTFMAKLNDLTDPKLTKLLQKINPGKQLIVSCHCCLHEKTRCGDILTKGFPMNGISQQLLLRRLCIGICGSLPKPVYLLNIQELSLNGCALTDTSCLSRLTWLSLSECHSIQDVHSLGNIPNLIIKDCQRIRDISALRNNQKLSIHRCHNIAMSTVNFENILYLVTDLQFTYAATTTLKNAVSLKLSYFRCSTIFLSPTVVSVEMRASLACMNILPLEVNLSNFSQSIKSVLLKNVSSSVDLTPLGKIEKVQLQFCRELFNVNVLKLLC
jgi:hypothetical protein